MSEKIIRIEEVTFKRSKDDLKEFEGAELKEITLTDVALKTEIFESKDIDLERDLMFVNFSTDKGVLQFTAYNQHNGYYGHSAIVISEQLNHEEVL